VQKYIENDYMAGLSMKSEIFINFDATSDEFITVPFLYVLLGEIDPELFRDAIVLIGITAVGFEFDHSTTTVEKDMRLVYAHANIINQLIDGSVTTKAERYVTLTLMLLLLV